VNAPDLHAIQRTAIDGAVFLPVELVRPSPTNPRKHFDQQHLQELADSLAKVGQISPIVVRPIAAAKAGEPLYEIVAGERRWRACKLASLGQVMALVRELTDFEVLELQVIENLQRDDLHPLEEAEGYAALLRKPDGVHGYANAEELAARIGKSRRYVYNRLQLLKLCDEAKLACFDGRLQASVALLITTLPADQQAAATARCLDGWGGEPYTQRQAAAYLRRDFGLRLEERRFPIADATLVPSAGACTECPKRTACNPDLFTDETAGADTCLDRQCFDSKVDARRDRDLQRHRDLGREVITGNEARKIVPYHGAEPRGYANLAAKSPLALSNKPLCDVLGEGFDKVVAVQIGDDVLELAKEADVKKALKAKGLLKPPAKKDEPRAPEPDRLLPKGAKGKAPTAAEIAAAKKKAVGERWPQLALQRIAKAALERSDQLVTISMAQAIALRLATSCESSESELLAMAGLAVPAGTRYLNQQQVSQSIANASPQQLYALTVVSLAADELYELERGGGHKDHPLIATAVSLNVDLDAARAEAKAEVEQRMAAELQAAQPAAKQPPAAKKTTAKKADKAKDATAAFVDAQTRTVEISGQQLQAGATVRVRKATAGRKTAKDQRQGEIESVLDDGRVCIRWGKKPHEKGVYDAAELEVPAAPGGATLNPDAVRTDVGQAEEAEA
jgi:ParB/RepB/Spo0J family partition protein